MVNHIVPVLGILSVIITILFGISTVNSPIGNYHHKIFCLIGFALAVVASLIYWYGLRG